MTVQSSDPQVFEWHIYTEGWGKGSADRYDFASINQFAAPWMANMPGWLIFGYWQYENELLDELGQKIFMGDFSSRAERDELYRQATQVALDESVRVWLATTFNVFPANPKLSCVTEDIVSGPKSMLTLREAHVPGKDTLRAGHFWVWTERSVWNTVGGFGDVFSSDIWKNINDPSMATDPFSGRPTPFRADFQVETAGAGGAKLAVPEGAVMWNAEKNKWEPVPQGTQATSRVVFDLSKYFGSVWHNERPIQMADVLYNLSASFDRVYDPEKQRIEFVLAAVQRPLLDVFRGFRVLDDNRIEAYVDYWHFDEAYIASYADVVSLALPWEIMAASDELVYGRRQAAYSQASSARYSVPWLSLAESRGAGLVARVLKEFSRNSYVPEGAFDINGLLWEDSQGAKARYDATLEWFDEYNHLIISNGPFILANYDPAAQYAELRAFRHVSYPFKPGDWYRQRPQDIAFTNVSANGDTISVELSGTGELELRYVVVDPRSGKVQATGVATKTSDTGFEVTLTSDLSGRYQSGRVEVLLIASSDELARVYEYRAFN
jgi:peptide/nickel transport system substrate-binding protein